MTSSETACYAVPVNKSPLNEGYFVVEAFSGLCKIRICFIVISWHLNNTVISDLSFLILLLYCLVNFSSVCPSCIQLVKCSCKWFKAQSISPADCVNLIPGNSGRSCWRRCILIRGHFVQFPLSLSTILDRGIVYPVPSLAGRDRYYSKLSIGFGCIPNSWTTTEAWQGVVSFDLVRMNYAFAEWNVRRAYLHYGGGVVDGQRSSLPALYVISKKLMQNIFHSYWIILIQDLVKP